jgi:hypothetical protein
VNGGTTYGELHLKYLSFSETILRISTLEQRKSGYSISCCLFKLHQSAKETQEQFISKDIVNNLGVARYYKENGTVFQEIHHWVSKDGHHDAFYTMCVFNQMLEQAKQRGITKIYGWSDNGNHFRCAMMMMEFFEACTPNYNIEWVGNHKN